MASEHPPPDDPGPQENTLLAASRSRSDVAERRRANAETEVIVVKCSLNAFCTEEARSLPWELVVKNMTKMAFEASLLANAHAIRMCCRVNDPNDELEELQPLEQIFFSRCLSAVCGRRLRSPDPDFQASVELYNRWRGEAVERAGSTFISSGWQQCTARQVAANAKTAARRNFFKRFNLHLRREVGLDGRDAHTMLEAIVMPNYGGDNDGVLAWRDRLEEFRLPSGCLDFQIHRLLPLTHWFASRTSSDVPHWVASRSCSLLPLRNGFKSGYFTMDTNGLWALLRRAGLISTPFAHWRDEADARWHQLFCVSKFETATRRFAGEIQTDGKTASILLRKPSRRQAERPLNAKDYSVAWGLDPGMRDMFVATSNDGRVVRCSTREFYEDARVVKSLQKIKVWQDSRDDVMEATRSLPQKATVSLETLERYVRCVIPRMDLLFGFYRDKPFRKLRFRRQIHAKKKIDRLCALLTDAAGTRTIVGFGDWGNIATGIKCPRAPVQRFKKELSKWCKVVSIDEFRTSVLHSACHGVLQQQHSHRKVRGGLLRRVAVHSVLHCRPNGCHGTTMNRDVNASENMLTLLQCELRGQPRPPKFTRGTRL